MSKWKYDSFLWVMSIFADTFFREVHPRGSWKVPRHGPILFVAAPHANQVRYALELVQFHFPEILPHYSYITLLTCRSLCFLVRRCLNSTKDATS
jgi:hypothetical protein